LSASASAVVDKGAACYKHSRYKRLNSAIFQSFAPPENFSADALV